MKARAVVDERDAESVSNEIAPSSESAIGEQGATVETAKA